MAENELDFEWPTQDLFRQMQTDVVAIKSLSFANRISYHDYSLASVQCTLTNGQSSAVFEKAAGMSDC